MPTAFDSMKYPSVVFDDCYAPISQWTGCGNWNEEVESKIYRYEYDETGNKIWTGIPKFHEDSVRMRILHLGNASNVFMLYGNGTFDEHAVYVYAVDNGRWQSRFIYDAEWIIIFKEFDKVFDKSVGYDTVSLVSRLANNACHSLYSGVPIEQVLSENLKVIAEHCRVSYNRSSMIYGNVYDNDTIVNTMIFWSSWFFFACLSEERKAGTRLGSLIKGSAFIDAVDEHPDWGLYDICNHYRSSYADVFGLQGSIVSNVRNICKKYGIITSWNSDT